MTHKAQRPADTASVLTYRMGIPEANPAGNVHGGWIMKLFDDVAVVAATRLAGSRVVTARVDGMTFRSPIHVGHLVTLRAMVNGPGERRWRSACGSRRRTCTPEGSRTHAPRT